MKPLKGSSSVQPGKLASRSPIFQCDVVIVRIVGGLGNQLFQYATARRLALLRQAQLRLDVTPFEHYKLHSYALQAFRIQETFATPEEIGKIRRTRLTALSRIALPWWHKLSPYYRRPVLKESIVTPFDPNMFRTRRRIYLDGYWQSERYFADIRDLLLDELTIKYEQDKQSREISRQIDSSQSVSIHVRRGDYVSNPGTLETHGICNLEYYEQCVRMIAERIGSPSFFVFSDDPDWVRDNLLYDYPMTFVTHNDASKNYEDLRLMSMCQHNIIANSSFSWWGAWLNRNPNKIVLYTTS